MARATENRPANATQARMEIVMIGRQNLIRSHLTLWSFILFALFSPPAHSQDQLPDLVRRIKPSAVAIETFDARGEKLSRGSGFFIDVDRKSRCLWKVSRRA